MIPPLPKNYDVENRGHFSAGRLSPTKKPAKTKAKLNSTATYGNDVEGDETPKTKPTETTDRLIRRLYSRVRSRLSTEEKQE